LLGKVAYWKDRPREHTETSKALVDTMAFKDYRLRKPRPRKVEWSEIVRTYDNGAKTAKQVAEELNLNDNWVRSVLRREGVFKPRKVHVGITKEQVLDAFANGCTSANELGKALGCCSEQARRWAKKVNRKFPKRNARWTEELIERVRKLAALDITSKIISNILGGTPSASAIVHAHSIYDLGLLPSAGRKVTYISPGKRIEHNPNWKEQYRDELSVS
jgi:bacterioferritin-associated ferredoxin